MLRLTSTAVMLAAVARAREIAAEAYTLQGPVLRALEAAARRGAHVVVGLEGRPYHDPQGHLARENAKLVRELRAAGADAFLGHPLHAKAIAADGTLYLDDKNWHPNDLVVSDDDPREIASIPGIKHEALAQEAAMLRRERGADAVIVESESFGCCNAVFAALADAARAGERPRLLVSQHDLAANARERRSLERLVRDGVRVRVCKDSEKIAVAGDRAWIGSANATIACGDSDMADWGVSTGDAAIVAAIRSRIEATWAVASDLKPQKGGTHCDPSRPLVG
jgi:phosphatidylserine/phosphatidylglycerophosphate/cardiolipin synthase-like enzyme